MINRTTDREIFLLYTVYGGVGRECLVGGERWGKMDRILLRGEGAGKYPG